jgi:hypothetical protein
MAMNTNRVLTGPGLANSRASVAVRIERALRIKHGEIGIDPTTLTHPQLAAMFGISVHRLRKAAKASTGNGALKVNPVAKQLRAFDALTSEQQTEFFCGLGRDRALELAVTAAGGSPVSCVKSQRRRSRECGRHLFRERFSLCANKFPKPAPNAANRLRQRDYACHRSSRASTKLCAGTRILAPKNCAASFGMVPMAVLRIAKFCTCMSVS